MMKWYSALLSIVVILVFSACTPVPKVNTLSINKLKTDKWQSSSVIILADSTSMELMPSGKQNKLKVKHVRWYQVNKTFPEKLKRITVYNSEYLEQKPVVQVTALYGGNKMKNISAGHYGRVYGNSGRSGSLWMGMSSSFFHGFRIPDYENVKFIRVQTSRVYHRPEHIFRELIRDSYNTLEKVITFTYPKSYSIKTGIENIENLPVSIDTTHTNQKTTIKVSASNLKEFDDEITSKFPENWYSGFYFSCPPSGNKSYSWEQLGDHYLAMVEDSVQNSPIITKIADKIKAKSLPQDTIIPFVFNYVKNKIRYYGSWEKAYSYIPRKPKTVLKMGYGDCKEMSTLTSYILEKLGYQSHQVLIMTSGNFQLVEKYPTLGAFNHMVSCVKDRGQYLFLDATHKNSSEQSSCYPLIGQKAFVLDKNKSQIVYVNSPREYKNAITTKSTLKPNGKVNGEAHFVGEVANDIYHALKNRGTVSEKKVVSVYTQAYLDIDIITSKIIEQDEYSVKITFTSDYSSGLLKTPTEGILLNKPTVTGKNPTYADISYPGDRYLHQLTQTDTWILPAGYTELSTKDIESVFGSGTWSKDGNTVTRHYSSNFAHITQDQEKQFKSFYKNRRNFIRGTVWRQ